MGGRQVSRDSTSSARWPRGVAQIWSAHAPWGSPRAGVRILGRRRPVGSQAGGGWRGGLHPLFARAGLRCCLGPEPHAASSAWLCIRPCWQAALRSGAAVAVSCCLDYGRLWRHCSAEGLTLACNLRLGSIGVLWMCLKRSNPALYAWYVGQRLPARPAPHRSLLQPGRHGQQQ